MVCAHHHKTANFSASRHTYPVPKFIPETHPLNILITLIKTKFKL